MHSSAIGGLGAKVAVLQKVEDAYVRYGDQFVLGLSVALLCL
jgi:hypothetical protein